MINVVITEHVIVVEPFGNMAEASTFWNNPGPISTSWLDISLLSTSWSNPGPISTSWFDTSPFSTSWNKVVNSLRNG